MDHMGVEMLVPDRPPVPVDSRFPVLMNKAASTPRGPVLEPGTGYAMWRTSVLD